MPNNASTADIELWPSIGAVESLQMIWRDIRRQLSVSEEGIRLCKPGALHDMRMALRRLGAAIKLFPGMLAAKQTKHILAEIKWIGRRLSFARDLDVFTAEIVLPLKIKYPADPHIRSLHRKCLARQKSEYLRVQAVLASKRFHMFSLEITKAMDHLDPTGAALDRPARAVVAESLARMNRKIRNAGQLKDLGRRDLHRFRLQIKEMRYALEFVRGLVIGDRQHKRFDKMLASLRFMQSSLGEIGDMAARREIFEKVAGRSKADPSINPRIVGLKLKNGRRRRKCLKQSAHACERFSRTKPFWSWGA